MKMNFDITAKVLSGLSPDIDLDELERAVDLDELERADLSEWVKRAFRRRTVKTFNRAKIDVSVEKNE